MRACFVPFHKPTELADGLGVESLPRPKQADSPLPGVVEKLTNVEGDRVIQVKEPGR